MLSLRFCHCWLIVGSLLVLLFGGLFNGTEVVAQGLSRDVKLNRIFVPAGKPETWPEGDWVPVSEERLRNLLAHQVKPTARLLVIDDASLRAEFDPERLALLRGVANFQFATTTPRDRLATLSPCNLAIAGAQWSAFPQERPVIGYDDNSQLLVAVPAEVRELALQWQLAGTRRLNGCEFDIRLPRAIVSQLEIETPADWSLTSSAGAVSRGGVRAGKVSWTIVAGQQSALRLQLIPDTVKQLQQADSIGVLYRQTSTVNLTRGRLDAIVEFAIDPQSLPTGSLEFAVPKLFRVESASVNGRVLAARDVIVGAPDATGSRLATLIVASPLATATLPTVTQSVILRLSSPYEAGLTAATLVLPKLARANSVLLSGQLDLHVGSSLGLVQYEGHGLRQVEVQNLEGVHRLTFQQDRARASLDLRWTEHAAIQRLTAREFVLLDFEDNPPTFETDLEIAAQTGGLFELTALLPRAWEVSDVFVAGSNATLRRVHWSIANASIDTTNIEQQRLTVHFPDGVSAGSPMTLRVNGQFAGSTKANDSPVPLVLLEPSAPLSLHVAAIAPAGNVASVLGNGRFQLVTSDAMHSAVSWTQLSSLVTGANARVWSVHVSDAIPDLRETSLRLQSGVADAVAPTGSKTAPAIGSVGAKPDATGADPKNSRDFQPLFSGKLTSTLSPGRVSRDQHVLTLVLMSSTTDGLLEFKLPSNAQLQHLEWNGQKVAKTDVGSRMSVPLTNPQANDRLSMHYTLPSERVFLRETYRAHLPEISATVIGLEWDVQVPSRFLAVSFSQDFAFDLSDSRPSWLAWLFGPLARSQEDRFFNPFSAESWTPMFVSSDELTQIDGVGSTRVGQPETGWSGFSAQAPVVPESLTIELCDRLRLKAVAWLILALTLCIGVGLRAIKTERRTLIGILWLAIAVSATVLIPSAYAELIGATILGSLLACLLPRRLIRGTELSAPPQFDGEHMDETVTIQRASLVLLLIALGTRSLHSQDLPTTTAAATGAALESLDVLIEYEGDRFQVPLKTGLVCVPAKSLEQLVRHFNPPTPPKFVPLFSTAKYSSSFASAGAAVLKARWEIWIPPTANRALTELLVPLPIRNLMDRDGCRVDGQPVEIAPTANGASFRVTVPAPPMPEKPQKNEKTAKTDPAAPPPAEDRSVSAATAWRLIVLEVSLRPTQTRRGPEVELSLPLPRTLLSDLQIDVTGEPRETLRAPRGFLGTAQDRALQGSLEPTSELRLIVSPINAPLTSEQYSVRVRSFTETSGEFARRLTFGRYKIERGEVSLIAWKLPPGSIVQTDRIQATQLAGTQIRRTADETLVLLEFSPPQTSDFDVVLPWLLAEPPIEGDRKFTWARPVSASHASASNTSAAVEIREHQAGIAAVAGLTVKTDAGLLSSNATDIEQSFLASWPAGTSVRRPQLVFDAASASPPNWRVQPISVDRTARWNAVARISRDSIEWIFTCEVELSGAPAFVHELDVASRLKVESVAVLQDDVSRLRHWAQFENRLLLHLRDRSTGQQTIRIVARESIAAGQSINPPKIELVGARAFESHLHLSRNREVTVDVQGVEAADSTVPESTTEDADFAFVGHYRLRAISDAALLVTPLPTVSRSWCVATIDRSEEDPSVELAINLAAGRLRATTLRLPNWPLAPGASWDLDGDPATTMTPSSTEPGVWLIQLRQRLDLPLLIRLRVPLLFADDDMPLLLAAPELQGVTEQTIGWVAPSQLEGTPAASAVLPANKQTELLARGIVAPVIASSSIVDWSQSRLPVSRTEHDVNANAELPALFAHRVQLGHHDRTSGVTRLLAGGSAQTLLRLEWPTSIRVTACTLNGRLTNIGTIANGQLAVPLDESSGLATVELYWEHTESGQSLRIAQRVLPLVKVFGVRKVVERAVVMSPKTRSVLTTAPVSSDDWRSARQTWSELLTNRPRLKRGPVAELLNSVSTDFAADVVKSDVPLAQPTTAGHIDRREVVVTNHNELRYWVVDERLSEFLLSFFLALIAAPLILVLVRLKTGEALSRWPAASATLLTLIWWFCLQGSALGFAAAALAATVALLHALRHMLAQP